MYEAMAAYHECGFDGVMTPDHTPRVVSDEPPGLKGRAFALGYMRGLMQAVMRDALQVMGDRRTT
jgi:mannonate dehydratase